MDIRYIDTFELARSGRQVQGQAPLGQFARLMAGLPRQAGTLVRWSLQGESDAAGRSFVTVRAQAEPTLECQRCLSAFVYPVNVDNRLEIVDTEAGLADEDADPEDAERILGSQRFDVLALVEDELILGLPYVPKHDVCPSEHGSPAKADAPQADDARPSPFAVLERLKKN